MQKLLVSPVTNSDFIDQRFEIYATCDSEIKELNSLLDKEILMVRQKYAPQITAFQKEKDQAFADIESFATVQKDILFSVKRSFTTRFGTFGFRLGKPRFVLRAGTAWDNLLNYIEEHLPTYARVVVEPAKDKLMADRNIPEIVKFFYINGISIEQDDNFYIELKK